VVVLSAQYALWSIGVYGFVFWLPSIIKAAPSHGIGVTGLLSAGPYALAVVLVLGNSRASDRVARRRAYIWLWLVAGAVAFYLSYALGTTNFWPAYVLLIIAGGCMYAPYGPYFAWITEFLPENVSGASMALINSFGALGGFVGAYAVGWLDGATNGPGASFLLMAVALLAAGLLMFLVRQAPATLRGTTTPIGICR